MPPRSGSLADVWRQLVLAEVVRAGRPRRFAEVPAAPRSTPLGTGPEERYGLRRAAALFPRPSVYLDVARAALTTSTCPGPAEVAAAVVPDLDVFTGPDVRAWLAEGPALLHVAPADPWLAAPGSTSGLALVADAARSGHVVVFWYGYDVPDDRDWALTDLDRPDLWAGDVLVTTAAGTVEGDGDLALATTPGTGCGVVVGGVDPSVFRRLEQLGEALVATYAGAPLPDGRAGALDLLVDRS